jgi:hypothetical protein
VEASWESRLGHQLPALPPLARFLHELPTLFDWLEGTIEAVEVGPYAYADDEDAGWSPPPTGGYLALGRVARNSTVRRRKSSSHRSCVQRSRRLIEPYSLRCTEAGFLVLHAERADGGGPRTYQVDQMQGLQVTTRPFQPRFPIEFSARGPLHTPPQVRTGGTIIGVTGVRSRSSREFGYAGSLWHPNVRKARSGSS